MSLPSLNQPSLAWLIRDTPSNLVAQYGIDFTTYSAATFQPSGTVSQNVAIGSKRADGVGIDNSSNANFTIVSVGSSFVENIPPFTKSVVYLGDTSQQITISSLGGQILATFYTGIYPGSIAQTNQLGANKAAIAVYLPPATLQMYAGLSGNIPDGYLLCNGQAVSRLVYSLLFSAIGTMYGKGDGSSTFNVPDLRDRAIFGSGNSYNIAQTGGEPTHTLGASEIPGHTHNTYGGSGQVFGLTSNGNQVASGNTFSLNDLSSDVTGPYGGGAPHNNMPPFLAMNFIIKT